MLSVREKFSTEIVGIMLISYLHMQLKSFPYIFPLDSIRR